MTNLLEKDPRTHILGLLNILDVRLHDVPIFRIESVRKEIGEDSIKPFNGVILVLSCCDDVGPLVKSGAR